MADDVVVVGTGFGGGIAACRLAEEIAALYPRWPEWLAVEREFNRTGVFDSPFTRRVGITRPR